MSHTFKNRLFLKKLQKLIGLQISSIEPEKCRITKNSTKTVVGIKTEKDSKKVIWYSVIQQLFAWWDVTESSIQQPTVSVAMYEWYYLKIYEFKILHSFSALKNENTYTVHTYETELKGSQHFLKQRLISPVHSWRTVVSNPIVIEYH